MCICKVREGLKNKDYNRGIFCLKNFDIHEVSQTLLRVLSCFIVYKGLELVIHPFLLEIALLRVLFGTLLQQNI